MVNGGLTRNHSPGRIPDVQVHIWDAPVGAGPESTRPIMVMDFGLARFIRALRRAIAHRGTTKSLLIDGFRIELDVRVHERQSRPALACIDLAVEARTTAGVARRA